MCGIAGYIGTGELEPWCIDVCIGLMQRRGPDAHGVYRHVHASGRRVVLLHSRLSIIDLDARSNQPFVRGGAALVFNGELYNYSERRETLAAEGAAFETASDTEVLFEVLTRDGIGGLDACEGMWAFARYREEDGVLLLGRDRFGEKPLYVLRDEGGIYFGSEVKFIAALRGTAPPVNIDHLLRYLVNGYKSLYKVWGTFFLGVEEVPRASVLEVRADASEHLHGYWAAPQVQDDGLSFDDCTARAREALIESVGLRLRSDVPLAFCMSGGVDSNALIAIARRLLDYDVHGFTIENADARYEERDMVEYAVRELGVRHTSVPLGTGGFLERLRELVRHHDAPVYTITYYVQWLLLKEVAQSGYKISISGTGADEMFSGYYDHFLAHLYMVRGEPAVHAPALAGWEREVKPWVRNPHLGNPRLFADNPGFREHIYLNCDEFSEYLHEPWREPFAEMEYTGDLLRNRMLNELFHESVPVILHEDDLNAMYHSVENRSPFLDRGIFEACATFPTRHLIRNGRAKAILREAMRGIVPDRILDNPRKVGFNAPIHALLDTRDAAVRSALMDLSPVFDWVRRDKIEALLAREVLPNSESKFLFNFLNMKFFLEEFAE